MPLGPHAGASDPGPRAYDPSIDDGPAISARGAGTQGYDETRALVDRLTGEIPEQGSAPHEPAIGAAMNRLMVNVDGLAKWAGIIEERISFVLRSELEEQAPSATDEADCAPWGVPLADALEVAATRLHDVQGRLARMHDRIEL
jgi:hypothetical protein